MEVTDGIRYKVYGIKDDKCNYLGQSPDLKDAIEIAEQADKWSLYDEIFVDETKIAYIIQITNKEKRAFLNGE